jgi:hypothetical protein
VRDLLGVPGLGLRLLTDVAGLDRAIGHVYTTDLPDPGRYLTPGDLVLTGMIWCREPGDAERFVQALTKGGALVLGAGEALGQVPPELIQACGRHGVTLLAVPPETSFAAVTEEVSRRLSGDRASAMTRQGSYSLFGIGGDPRAPRDPRDPRITGLFLACQGQEQDWPHELQESVAELVADVALERARLDAGRAGDRKLAEAIVTMLASEAGEGEVAPLMRTAGLPPDGRYLLVRLCADASRVTGPNAGRWACDLAEELAAGFGDGAVAAPFGDEVVLLVPLPSREDPQAAHAFAARLREAEPLLAADGSRVRLSVGLSAPADGVAALPGALHEAGSARRLAALRGREAGTISVLTSDEVASHEVLLATLPATVLRSFRDRLLAPLLAYDSTRRAELLPTLREFLGCSGSWNACAARMYVHVNTVRYRIRRIEELTGRDLSRLEDQVDFFLALRIR